MKNLLFSFLAILFMLSCNNAKKEVDTIPEEKPLTLEGTWDLRGHYNYNDNKISDSFGISLGSKQVKMFTGTHVMWARKVPSDSTEFFGFGKYKITDTSLVETLDYGSTFMNQAIEENIEFSFELILEKNKYIQIELDDDGNRIFSENYIRIE